MNIQEQAESETYLLGTERKSELFASRNSDSAAKNHCFRVCSPFKRFTPFGFQNAIWQWSPHLSGLRIDPDSLPHLRKAIGKSLRSKQHIGKQDINVWCSPSNPINKAHKYLGQTSFTQLNQYCKIRVASVDKYVRKMPTLTVLLGLCLQARWRVWRVAQLDNSPN